MSPRALVWTYLTALLAAAAATLVGLAALLIRYLPHEYLTRAGLACKTDEGCATALPQWAGAGFSFLLGGILIGFLLFAAFTLSSQMSASGRRRLDLVRVAGRMGSPLPPGLRGRTLLIDDPCPLSYTIGFLRPAVVVSTGLFETLDAEEVQAVLAHEEAHVAARDNLVLLLANTLAMTFALVPGVRLAFARLRRAQELAADDFATRRIGDSLVVASSLQKFARSLFGPARPAAAVGFAEGGNVTERIEGLLFGEVVRTSRRWAAGAILVLGLLFGSFVGSALAVTDVILYEETASAACHGHGETRDGAPGSAHGSCEGH